MRSGGKEITWGHLDMLHVSGKLDTLDPKLQAIMERSASDADVKYGQATMEDVSKQERIEQAVSNGEPHTMVCVQCVE